MLSQPFRNSLTLASHQQLHFSDQVTMLLNDYTANSQTISSSFISVTLLLRVTQSAVLSYNHAVNSEGKESATAILLSPYFQVKDQPVPKHSHF
jgi:hypothetical protein